MREAEARLGKFETLRPVLSELVGRAEALDGQIVVEWTAQGLSVLELNPRVMRTPSADLADAIKTAIADASADLREKTRAALADAGLGIGSAPSVDEVRDQLARIRENTMTGARQSAGDLARATELRRNSGV